MTYFTENIQAVRELCRELVAAGFAPFVGARCDALAPLHDALDVEVGVLTVARDDNAIGIAAGVSLAGGYPAVLLRNSGPGGAAEVITSLVAPHEVPMLLIVALGAETGPAPGDPTMIRLSEQVLDESGIQSIPLDTTVPMAERIGQVHSIVHDQLRPAALLVPELFGRPV